MTSVPARVASPSSYDGILDVLADASSRGHKVKVMGAGHSFSDIAATDGVQLTLDDISGVISVDLDRCRATIKGGTRLRDVGPLLARYGLALENMGDIDHQSLAGAISTGTHGTGLAFTGFGGQVRSLTLALASGELVTCSTEDHPDLFRAAQVGLGAIGVILEVTLQCVPLFCLQAQEALEPLDSVLESFVERSRSTDHLEFYWFPYTSSVLTKSNTRLPMDTTLTPIPRWSKLLNDEVLGNGALSAICRLGAAAPRLIPAMNNFATRAVSPRTYTDLSRNVFVSPRRVRFNEMEYAMPLEAFPKVFREVCRAVESFPGRISFPLEVRTAAADDVWLSTAYQRPSVYIAVHRYSCEPYEEYFRALENIFVSHGGRPHWGKLHTRTSTDFQQLYPQFGAFRKQRAAVDPEGLFVNPYLSRVLGVDERHSV